MGFLFAFFSAVVALMISLGAAGEGGLFMFCVILLAGLIPAAIASGKGRDFGMWWGYGMLLWIVAFVHALLLEKDVKEMEGRALASGEMKKCPYCAELIRREALKCKHCGSDVSLAPSEAPAPSDLDYAALAKGKAYIKSGERQLLIKVVKDMENASAEDAQGKTLLDFAEELGAKEMRQILSNLGVRPGSGRAQAS